MKSRRRRYSRWLVVCRLHSRKACPPMRWFGSREDAQEAGRWIGKGHPHKVIRLRR